MVLVGSLDDASYIGESIGGPIWGPGCSYIAVTTFDPLAIRGAY